MKSDLVQQVEFFLNSKNKENEESKELIELTELQHLLENDTNCYNHFMKTTKLRFQEPSDVIQYIRQCGIAVLDFFGLDNKQEIDEAYKQQRESIVKVQDYLAQMRAHIGSELPRIKKSKKRVVAQGEMADSLIETLDDTLAMEEEERFHKELYSVRIKNKKKHCDIALREYQLVERALRAIYASVLFMHDHTCHAIELMDNTLNGYGIMQNWTGLGKTFFHTLDQVGDYRQKMREHLLEAVDQSRTLANLTQPYTPQPGEEHRQYIPE